MTTAFHRLVKCFFFFSTAKKAIFKAMVSGEPAPAVTWERDNGKLDDPEIYLTRYDERAQEHILEVRGCLEE